MKLSCPIFNRLFSDKYFNLIPCTTHFSYLDASELSYTLRQPYIVAGTLVSVLKSLGNRPFEAFFHANQEKPNKFQFNSEFGRKPSRKSK